MYRLFRLLVIISLFFLPFTQQVMAADPIRLTIPQSVITEVTRTLLPINIDTHSKSVDGDITIINISNVKLTDKHLACRLHLAGNNLALLTEIAGHEIRLKVGSIELDVTTDAALRFDAKKQVLYLKPVIKNMGGGSDGANGEIGKALIAMLNGREFPINMQQLDPLIAQTGSKTVTINTEIVNIEAKPEVIQLSLKPIITAQ